MPVDVASAAQNRFAAINIHKHPDTFLLLDAAVTERISEPYVATARAFGLEVHYDLSEMLGTRASIRLGESPSGRFFGGVLTDIAFVGTMPSPDDRTKLVGIYEFTIRSNLSLLKQRRNCRIFQDKTAIEIIKEVLTNGGLDVRVLASQTYQPLIYCTQYDETDFDFISRLMEQEGVFYFFEHQQSGVEKIFLCDANSQTNPAPTTSIRYDETTSVAQPEGTSETIWRATRRASVATKKVSLTDFSFQNPKKNQLVEKSDPSAPESDKGEFYDYPGKFSWDAAADSEAGKLGNERSTAERYSLVRLQALRAERLRTFFEGRSYGLAAGQTFKVQDHPESAFNIEYLTVSVSYGFSVPAVQTSSQSPSLTCQITTIPKDIPFRPQAKTPRAMVFGPQTATVVGPKKDPLEVHTDKFGRVKVKFHWDRLGKADDTCSCWVRVSQMWAGAGFGAVALPRVDQEVIVEFLDGDPDRPIITGRVYNGDNSHAYTLPAEKWKFSIRSRSLGNVDNELRFDDTKDKEQFYQFAGKNMDTVVIENQTIKIKKNRTVTVEEGNEIYEVSQGNQDITVKQGNQKTEISQGNQEITVKSGNQKTEVTTGKSHHKAGQSIKLEVGASTIEITPSSITIKSPSIKIQADGTLDAKSPMTKIEGDGLLILKGGLVKIN